jgi:plasmid maintenance system antidote protein VapI
MAMRDPIHPGDFGLNQNADLSGEMALRIEKASAVNMDTLMRMQAADDIAQTRKNAGQIRVLRYDPDAAHVSE